MFEGAILVLKVPNDMITVYMIQGNVFAHAASVPASEEAGVLAWVELTHVRSVAFEPDYGISGLYMKKD